MAAERAIHVLWCDKLQEPPFPVEASHHFALGDLEIRDDVPKLVRVEVVRREYDERDKDRFRTELSTVCGIRSCGIVPERVRLLVPVDRGGVEPVEGSDDAGE